MPIDFNHFAMRLFRKSRELAWDPLAIDLAQDRRDFESLSELERRFTTQMVVGFLIGERGVTHDLAPLQRVLRREKGRMEEEMYLSAQLFEEAQHVEFFQRWLDEVPPRAWLASFRMPYTTGNLFTEILPRVMGALDTDPSPPAQLRASVTYHMIVEGVIGETGYSIFYAALESRGLLPGLLAAVHHIQRDEVRHIAFGNHFLQRLLRENRGLEPVFEHEMEAMHPVGADMPDQVFMGYDPGRMPFDLDPHRFKKINEQLYATRKMHVLKGVPAEI